MEKKEKMNWLFQGLVLAAIPAFAYLLAFTYELGYAMFFGIPIELISLSTALFCLVFIALIPLSIVGFYLFNSIFKGIHLFTHKYPKVDRFANNWSLWIVISTMYLIYLTDIPWVSVLKIVLSLLVFLIVFDLLIRPLYQKMNKALEKGNDYRFTFLYLDEPITRIEKMLGLSMNKLLSFIFLVFLSTFLIGMSTGSRTQMFMITTDIPTKIVLRTYNGYMVLANFDRGTKEVGDEFITKQIGDLQGSFKWENTGEVEPLGSIYSKTTK